LARLALYPQFQRLGTFIDLRSVDPVTRPSQNFRPVAVSQTAESTEKQPPLKTPSNRPVCQIPAQSAIFTLTHPAGKQFVGVAVLHGGTALDPENNLVTVNQLTFTSINSPSLDPTLIASVPKKESAPAVELRSDSPAIFVSSRPAILLFVDGPPQHAPIPNTKLEFVANTTRPLFLDRKSSEYYLLVGKQWMTASAIEGPWTSTNRLARDMGKL
jgi:hypothetical protein